MRIARRVLHLILTGFVLASCATSLFAVEKGSEQVSPFMGSFSYSVPIEVPAFHGLEPRLGLVYTSEGRNGLVGVGWNLAGFGTVERTNAGGGTPRFDAQDVFVLNGAKLLPCTAGITSPSCTTGGTHTTETESFTRVRFDAAANTWTLWSKNGVRTVFAPLLSATGGTYKWGQSSVIDTLGNTVTYAWTCTTDCYPSSVSYGPYQVSFFRETRPDVISFARGVDLGRTSERLRSVIVFMPGASHIRGYKLSYTLSDLTGRSLLSAVQQYGRDLTHDGAGLFTGGSTLPAQTFAYTEDALGRSFVSAAAAPPTPPATTEAVSWAERNNVTPVGDGSSLKKTDGVNYTWDAFASSTRALASGDGYVEVTAGADPGKRFGLGRKAKDFTPDDIDFSFLESNGGSGHVVSAYQKATSLGSWPAPVGALLRVEISSGAVLFKIDGAVVYTLATPRVTYPLVAAASLSFNNAVIENARLSGALQDANSWCWGEQLLTGDFNGDGRTDQACYTSFTTGPGTTERALRVKLSNGSGFADPVAWSTGIDFSRAVGGDFNNDGKTDLATFSPFNSDVSVALSTGTALAAPVLWGHAAADDANGFPVNCSTPYTALGAGDFNGDGQLDVSCRQAWRGDLGAPSPILIGLSNGTGFTFSVWGDLGCDAPAYQRTGAIDFDGDGKDDWYCQSGAGNLQVYVSTGDQFIYPAFGSLSSSFCGSRYVLGDFNGDGRTDAACADNGKLALSNGKTFVEQGTYGAWCAIVPTEDPISTQVFAADVDGDGASEIVCNNAQAGRNDITVRKWSDAGLSAAETWKANWCEGLLRGGDFDGDGKTDLLCDNLGTPVAFTGTAGTKVDLLTRVVNQLGGTVEATYVSSTTFPNTNNPPVRPVLASTTTHDGRGSAATATFSYAGGKIDRKLRRFLGFRSVRQVKPCLADETACPYRDTWLRQDGFVGPQVERSEERSGSGQLLASAVSEYTATAASPPYSSLPIGFWTYDYDAGGGRRRTYATSTYDAYGNVTQQVAHGDADIAGDETTVVAQFSPDLSAYIVDRAYSVSQFAGIGGGGALLQRTTFAYDSAGQLSATHGWTDTSGATVTLSHAYDAWGNRTNSTDASGAVTTTAFDDTYHLFPVQATNPVGESTTSAWDAACGAATQVTDSNGQLTTHQYDAFCRLIRSDGPLATFTIQRFLDWGLPASQRITTESPSPAPADGTGNAFATQYLDGWGRAYRSERKGAQAGHTYVTDRGYDARGNLAWAAQPYDSTQARSALTTYHYDAHDRVVRLVLPDNHETTIAYGAWQQTATDPVGHGVTSYFDAYGRMLRSEEEDNQGRVLTTHYTYDQRGNQTAMRDPAGNVWSWTYDLLGRQVVSTDPDAGTWTVAYDVLHGAIVQTDAKGQVTELHFDPAGRLLTKTNNGSLVATLTYGEPRAGYFNVGRLTSMADAHGSERHDYDALGREVRLTRTLDGTDYTLLRRFTTSGQLAGVTFPDGDTFGTPADPLRYDAAGRVTAVPGVVSAVLYDAADRPVQRTNGNGSVTTWQYHDRGWLTDIATDSPAGVIQALRYTADATGRVTAVTSPFDNESWSYAHDALGRLTSATNLWDPAHSQAFAWDAAGNLSYNSRAGTLTYPSPGAPRPHAPALVAGAAMSYDDNGNLVAGRGRSIIWSADNLPVQIDAVRFAYDGFGARLTTLASGGNRLYPLGDDYEIAGGVVTKYLSLPGMGVVAKRVGSTTYWLHTDRLGSVQAVTDASGAVVQRRTYRPFGEKIADTTAFGEALGFIGERQDDETGLTYLHARYYDPALGVFLSPDPAQADSSSYRYAAGDPVNFSDASGLNPQPGFVFCYPDCSGGGGYGPNASSSSGPAGSLLALLHPVGDFLSDFWHGLFGGGPSADQIFWKNYWANPANRGLPSSPSAPWGPGKFSDGADAVGAPGLTSPITGPPTQGPPSPAPAPPSGPPATSGGPGASSDGKGGTSMWDDKCGTVCQQRPAAPPAPPGANLGSNLDEARVHYNPFWFYDQVRNRGPWDYKQRGRRYQPFGNFNYGATCRAFGFSELVCLDEAGRGQIQAGTSRPAWGRPSFIRGLPSFGGGIPPYGDDPVDQAWIKAGFTYYYWHDVARLCGCAP